MIKIYNYVKALKIIWIRKLEVKHPKWKPHLFACFPQLCNIAVFSNDFPYKCYKNINNPFWKDCIGYFCYFAKSIIVICFKDFLPEPIFNNCHIKINNKTFVKKDMA